MKNVSPFLNAVFKGITKTSLLSYVIIFFLFGGIILNYYLEEGVNEAVHQHNKASSLIVKHEHYKQLIDKISVDLSGIDKEINQYLINSSQERKTALKQKIDQLNENMYLIKDEAAQYIPKYLVNIFQHKVRNRTDFQKSIITTLEFSGKEKALKLLGNTEDDKTSNEYLKSHAELTVALSARVKEMNEVLMGQQASTLKLDSWLNFASLLLMLVIACIVLYQTVRISILHKKLGTAFAKMQHATRVKDQFMSNITHELRTPLNSILGYTNLLLKRHHNPESEKWLQAVNLSGTMLLDIVNDVLDYSKLESGYLQMTNEPFQLDEVLSNLKNIMLNRAETKSLSMVILKDQGLPETFIGDEMKLKQILINLAGNAIKFTEKGSVKVEVSLHKQIGEQYWLQFQVTDSGIGMSPKNMEHIFERFYQVENSYTRKYSGTGLGLPIVKQLVDLQGGTITATSIVGEGTTFTIVLPFEKAHVKIEPDTAIMAPIHQMIHTAGKRILVVDDHELNRDLMVLLLKEYKYHVVTANNGYEALELLKKKHFDLVLMDVQMPDLNGIETTRKIRNLLTLDIPVIACTAFSQPSEKKACIDAGMNDYLGKPVEEKELVRLLSLYLGFEMNEKQGDFTLINFKQIQGITGNNKELMNIMLQKAIEAMPDELEQLHQSIMEKKYVLSREKAHTMCSTLGLMGAPEEAMHLARKIHSSSDAAFANNTVLQHYKDLHAIVEKLMTQIRHYLAA